MTIVITGGLGYVGGRLSKYFADKGFQVYAISRSKKVDYKNITVYTEEKVFEEMVLDKTTVNAVIHLAATNEITCNNDPQGSNEVNINGTLRWLEWSVKNQVKQFIYFSTVHVYSRPLIGTFSEESNCKPNHPYSISHKSAEDYVLWYKSDFNLNTKIVRLSNSFGYPAFPTADRWTLFINDICKQIASNHQFEIRSNALQHRDFISLTEVCDAINSLIGIDNPQENKESSIYNLSNGQSKSLLQIAKLVKRVAEEYLNKSIVMYYDEAKNEEAEEVFIDNQKLRQIGWEPDEDNYSDEIRKTIAYFIQNG